MTEESLADRVAALEAKLEPIRNDLAAVRDAVNMLVARLTQGTQIRFLSAEFVQRGRAIARRRGAGSIL